MYTACIFILINSRTFMNIYNYTFTLFFPFPILAMLCIYRSDSVQVSYRDDRSPSTSVSPSLWQDVGIGSRIIGEPQTLFHEILASQLPAKYLPPKCCNKCSFLYSRFRSSVISSRVYFKVRILHSSRTVLQTKCVVRSIIGILWCSFVAI